LSTLYIKNIKKTIKKQEKFKIVHEKSRLVNRLRFVGLNCYSKTQRCKQDKANGEPTAASLLCVNEQGGSAFNDVLRRRYAF